ncbi:MAG: DUF1801 domain-containing protein [Solobacterium sp.]|nr:DUF1801 domain-containing protein [Solobacterium sp.]MBR2670552.1 DUF1801 domain-containing protein [Solobacterium sp.]
MTIQEYINSQEETKQPRLQAIYDTIRTTIPEAEERISWGMPTFWKGRNIIHFATAKKHIGLYPGNEAVEEFAEKLKEYKTSKGAIQLPDNRELPLSLIAEISRWCYENNKK